MLMRKQSLWFGEITVRYQEVKQEYNYKSVNVILRVETLQKAKYKKKKSNS